MESKFIYIVNGSDKNIYSKVSDIPTSDQIIYNDCTIKYNNQVIIVPLYNSCDKDELKNINDLFSDKWTDNLNIIAGIIKEVGWNGEASIYVSIHPGGGSLEEIKSKLIKLNSNDSLKGANIKVTYHGSQWVEWDKISDINELNAKVKQLIEPDVLAELHDNNEIVLLQMTLMNELLRQLNKVENKAEFLKSIFNIKKLEKADVTTTSIETTNDPNIEGLIGKIKEYRCLLMVLDKKYREILKLINGSNDAKA